MRSFLVLFLLSCGAPPPEPEQPHAIMSGVYKFHFFPGERTGDCDFIPTYVLGTLTFDDAGTLESPITGVLACSTEYPDGLPSFTCDGLGSSITGTARGVGTDRDGGVVEAAWGEGEFKGNVAGCRKIVFGFGFRRPTP